MGGWLKFGWVNVGAETWGTQTKTRRKCNVDFTRRRVLESGSQAKDWTDEVWNDCKALHAACHIQAASINLMGRLKSKRRGILLELRLSCLASFRLSLVLKSIFPFPISTVWSLMRDNGDASSKMLWASWKWWNPNRHYFYYHFDIYIYSIKWIKSNSV